MITLPHKILLFCLLLTVSFSLKAQVNYDLVGFATENGGTIGGQGGVTVTASSYSQLKSYAESSAIYTIMVEGTIDNGPDGGRIRIRSNKSIIGVGDDAFLYGVGLDVSNNSNIIIQNLKISLTGVTTRTDKSGVYSSTGDSGLPQILVNGGDCISISGSSTNIWIDHCEIFSEDPDVQTNKDLYDGLIDIKGNSGFITISWCYLHDHHKGGLVGASDSDLWDDRKITFHHNHYNKVRLRIPMYRGSVGHFFNNYIVGAKDATEIRANTCVRVEKNYYEALHYSIYTPSDAPGKTERIDNIEVSRTNRPYPVNCVANIPYDYSLVLTENTEDVKTIVPLYAGVGRLDEDCNGDLLGSAYSDDCGTCVGGNTGLEACVIDCNGDENGSASVDGCGICAGGNTGITPCDDTCTYEEYQAEDGNFSSGSIDSNHDGYTGTGFLNTDNAKGEWCEYTVNVSSAGTYNLRFRYGNGSDANRAMEVSVNESTQIDSLSFGNTADWTNWEFSHFTLHLNKGSNTIRFISLTTSGAANLDRLDVCSGDALGIENKWANSFFEIYPNPVNDRLTIELSMAEGEVAVVQIYNHTGQLIRHVRVENQSLTLNMKDLDSGLYLVKVSVVGRSIAKRFIKW